MAEINESKSETLYGCPECEKVCNAVEKNTCLANKMEAVAQLYGKNLGEEFKIKCPTGKIIRCRFSKKGLWYQETDKWNHDLFITDMLIAQLIRGEAVIVDD